MPSRSGRHRCRQDKLVQQNGFRKAHSVRQPCMDKRDHAQIRNDHQTLTAPPHRTGPFDDLSAAERAPEPPVITVEEQSRSVVARLDEI